MSINLDEITPSQADALREVGNIGAGHAATALSQLVGRKIYITVPEVRILAFSDIPALTGDPNGLIAGLTLNILGDATGKILVLFPRTAALHLADILLKQDVGASQVLNELGHSAIKEAGNILTGAYLAALNEFLGLLLLISVPNLVFDVAGAVLTSVMQGMDRDSKVIVIDTRFVEQSEVLSGYFILAPDPVSLRAIFHAIKVK
jgi:chemotaxis protein CheC